MGDIMGIFDAIKKNIFGDGFENKIMKSISKPVFIKDFEKESEEIVSLNQLLHNAKDDDARKKLQNELNLQKYVQDGLSKVHFELSNSPVPFYGLSNIKLEHNGTTSNIDFLLITHQFCCIIKCRSLQGNIQTDSQGNFFRWVKKNENWSKEGIYSPIEQNRRASTVINGILKDVLNLDKMPILSMVVFTNAKATINLDECPEDIKDKVIKVDLLNTKLKELVEDTGTAIFQESKALEIANVLNSLHLNVENNFENKFNLGDIKNEAVKTEAFDEEAKAKLAKSLKAYRSAMANSNNIPPYFVFNNEEMERLIVARPRDKEELLKVKGFGQVKIEKYGEDILKLINNIVQ